MQSGLSKVAESWLLKKQFLNGVAHLVISIKIFIKIETVQNINCRRKRMADDSDAIPEGKLNKMIDLMNDLNTNFGKWINSIYVEQGSIRELSITPKKRTCYSVTHITPLHITVSATIISHFDLKAAGKSGKKDSRKGTDEEDGEKQVKVHGFVRNITNF